MDDNAEATVRIFTSCRNAITDLQQYRGRVVILSAQRGKI
jgi:hypothetical protein